MKFKASASDLLFHLQKAYNTIPNKAIMRILENFKFEIKGGVLHITGTDLETTVVTSMEVNASEDFSLTIPASTIVDTLKTMPEQEVTIDYNPENENIKMHSQVGEYHLVGISVDDFPEKQALPDEKLFQIPAKYIIDAFHKTSFATSTDDVRTAMQGIYMEIEYDNKLNVVATDAHKLVKYSYNEIEADSMDGIVIPKKSASQVRNNLDPNDDVNVYANEKNIFFETENTLIIARLMNVNYPDYNTVIPTQNNIELITNRSELLNALKRIIIYANKATTGVTFEISDNSILMKAQDKDFANEAEEELDANYSGEKLKVGFSAKFLIEMLSVMDCESVQVLMSSPTRASLVLPMDDDESIDVTMLLMPLVIQNM